jgi:hypothetical protein
MAAPLYTQQEVAVLLAMPKRAPGGSWQPTKPKKKRRHNEFEHVAVVVVEPDPVVTGTGFELDICHNLATDELSITLYAEIYPRPLRPICRYDVQDCAHGNPDWFPPPLIAPGEFHRHVYSERAVTEGEPEDWDACAEALGIPTGGSPKAQLERLKKKAIDELNIVFEDRDTRNLLLDFGS